MRITAFIHTAVVASLAGLLLGCPWIKNNSINKDKSITIAPLGDLAKLQDFTLVYTAANDAKRLITLSDFEIIYDQSDNKVAYAMEYGDVKSEENSLNNILFKTYTPQTDPTKPQTDSRQKSLEELKLKYFQVEPIAYNFLNSVSSMKDFSATVGLGTAIERATMGASTKVYDINANLAVLYVTYIVTKTPDLQDKIARSLKSAGKTGKYKSINKIAVGGLLVTEIKGTSSDSRIGLGIKGGNKATLVGVDLSFKTSDAKLLFYQWGNTVGLSESDILDKLSPPNPSPLSAINAFRSKTTQDAAVATSMGSFDL